VESFQSVSVGQKTTGYVNGTLDFTADLLTAIKFVDDSLGAVINALKAKSLYEDTLMIVCSKHGQTPIDPATLKKVDPALFEAQLGVPHNHTTVSSMPHPLPSVFLILNRSTMILPWCISQTRTT
jgi:predicted AlkP superfamily pyrophosphatase or phosphodiesterase